MAGKGSAPRKDPTGSARRKWESNYDKIFGKKNDTQHPRTEKSTDKR